MLSSKTEVKVSIDMCHGMCHCAKHQGVPVSISLLDFLFHKGI
jgi:hypothetical protein